MKWAQTQSKALLLTLITLFSFGCSPMVIFPNDHKEYDSIQNYNYQYQEHTFYSQDKTALIGLHIKPKNHSKGIIVVANGIYENMSSRFSTWLWIVDSGYEVFIFDYRGYGKLQSDVDMYGFRDDVNAAIEYAHRLDRTKVMSVVGQSMGATFVIDAVALKRYTYVDLVVADSIFTSFPSIMSSFMLKSVVLIPIAWLPYTFSPVGLNSIENIGDIKRPILFVTGDSDWIVSDSNSKELYELAETQKALWIVKGAGHVEAFENPQLREMFLRVLENKDTLSLQKTKHFK